MTLEIWDEIQRRVGGGETVALCTISGTRGSTPQIAGAKMLVLANGRSIGTLGGGCVEGEVKEKAILAIRDAASGGSAHSFKLDHAGSEDGMICGGTLDVFVQTLRGAADAQRFADLASQIRAGEAAVFTIPEINYREISAPPPVLVIAGAGHVAQAVADLGARLDFHVTVIDDRSDLASKGRFPAAKRLIVGPIDQELSRLRIDQNTYIVLATRGHGHDAAALAAVVRSKAKYIGMLGSRRKSEAIFEALMSSGRALSAELEKVRTPVGLAISAITPMEIAVSICAELVAVRRAR